MYRRQREHRGIGAKKRTRRERNEESSYGGISRDERAKKMKRHDNFKSKSKKYSSKLSGRSDRYDTSSSSDSESDRERSKKYRKKR